MSDRCTLVEGHPRGESQAGHDPESGNRSFDDVVNLLQAERSRPSIVLDRYERENWISGIFYFLRANHGLRLSSYRQDGHQGTIIKTAIATMVVNGTGHQQQGDQQ